VPSHLPAFATFHSDQIRDWCYIWRPLFGHSISSASTVAFDPQFVKERK
jgi:hypothetical protein